MGLIKCADCKKKISDRIDNCPHCGCPVSTSVTENHELPKYSANDLPKIRAKKAKRKKLVEILMSVLLVIVIALGCMLFTANRDKGNPDKGNPDVKVGMIPSSDIVSVSEGWKHTVGLRKDGTVVAVGDNYYGQCNVEDWKDIVAISTGVSHTVGLRKDGTVVAVGYNDDGQCNVEDWKDIVSVSAGWRHTVGLRKDGTVVAVGCNVDGQCYVDDWEDIVSVSAGASAVTSTDVLSSVPVGVSLVLSARVK